MTKKKRYRRDSPECKREALKRAAEEGITDVQVCEELGISARQLWRWRDEYRGAGPSSSPSLAYYPHSPLAGGPRTLISLLVLLGEIPPAILPRHVSYRSPGLPRILHPAGSFAGPGRR